MVWLAVKELKRQGCEAAFRQAALIFVEKDPINSDLNEGKASGYFVWKDQTYPATFEKEYEKLEGLHPTRKIEKSICILERPKLDAIHP